MIRINLLKEEKKSIALDISKIKKFNVKEFVKSKAIFSIPIAGFAIFAVEVFYYIRLSSEVNTLRTEIKNLEKERDLLKQKVADQLERIKRLKEEINKVKLRIQRLERSKDVYTALKTYHLVVDKFFVSLKQNVPPAVWINQIEQEISFSDFNVSIHLGSYNIKAILAFADSLKKAMDTEYINFSEIEKRENEYGVIFYNASINLNKSIGKGNM